MTKHTERERLAQEACKAYWKFNGCSDPKFPDYDEVQAEGWEAVADAILKDYAPKTALKEAVEALERISKDCRKVEWKDKGHICEARKRIEAISQRVEQAIQKSKTWIEGVDENL